MTPYTELPGIAVGTGRQAFAEYAAGLAAGDLGIPPPEVRWFVRKAAPAGWGWRTWHDSRELAGEAHADRPGEVWIAADLQRRDLAEVIAHETHHDAWHRRNGPGWYSPAEVRVMEVAAEAFAAAFIRLWRF